MRSTSVASPVANIEETHAYSACIPKQCSVLLILFDSNRLCKETQKFKGTDKRFIEYFFAAINKKKLYN